MKTMKPQPQQPQPPLDAYSEVAQGLDRVSAVARHFDVWHTKLQNLGVDVDDQLFLDVQQAIGQLTIDLMQARDDILSARKLPPKPAHMRPMPAPDRVLH